MEKSRKILATAAVVLAAALAGPAAQGGTIPATNIILMISDGQGFNAIRAAEYYTGSPAVYQSFPVKLAMQTNSANNPAGYSPAAMAGDFNYAKSGATDSASAATAMYTGVKIKDGVINITPGGTPLKTYFEKAADYGKSVGAVSSVQISHATPGAVYGHNSSRNNYAAIGYEGVYGSNPLDNLSNSSSNPQAGNNALYDAMNYNGNLKVLMGAGHGDYNDNNQSNVSSTNRYPGGDAAWADIIDGTAPNGWTFIDAKGDFEAVANGTLNPDKLLGIAQVNSTLQQSRSAGNPLNTNVPTLETMTKAALNVLDNNPNGFAVMIEGGAVDWAGHANQLDRLIEEQTDFDNAVQAVCDYLDAGANGNNWSNTLLIVTADHETGHLWGAADGSAGYFDVNGNGTFDAGVDYAYMADNGLGVLPGAQFHSTNHTNVLVPLYAKGAGADAFLNEIIGADPNLAGYYNLDPQAWTGAYIDNTAIARVMDSSIPEPATMALLALAGSALGGYARRRRAAA